jgi:hypothetical protein
VEDANNVSVTLRSTGSALYKDIFYGNNAVITEV